MNLRLCRTGTGRHGTFGMLWHEDHPLCVTKEPRDPIIPPGLYKCKEHSGPRHARVWEVCDVPGHTAVLIHVGNYLSDTEGCILAGLGLGTDKGEYIVTQSAAAVNMLRGYLPKTFTLEIRNCVPLVQAPKPPRLPWWKRIFN